MAPQAVLGLLESTDCGLTTALAAARLEVAGRNRLPAPTAPGPLAIGLRQLRSPLIYILLAAALTSLALGEAGDAGFIAVVLVINSLVGGWQEWRAERQRQDLQRLLRVRATVRRDGRVMEIDAEELVPGDVVELESGQRVPADLRLLQTSALQIEEALLTGESLPAAKNTVDLCEPAAPMPERSNMAYAGTSVARGRGTGVVVDTGVTTAVGRLAVAVAAADTGEPPLVARMASFSRAIGIAVLAAAMIIGLVAILLHGASIAAMFTFGVALAVSAIPEGLPVAITIALAVAARRMAARGAIVRRLPAVEGLGSCTLIASDKTGTLTCNELTAREFALPGGIHGTVSGTGYPPHGAVIFDTAEPAADTRERLRALLEIAAACNDAELRCDDGTWCWRGDPTDVALLSLAMKGGVDPSALLAQRPRVAAIPFEAIERYAATFHRHPRGTWIAVKGAPERLLALCKLDPAARAAAQAAADEMAGRGYRVLALASTVQPDVAEAPSNMIAPGTLQWAGLVGMIDPLRPEAKAAVRDCRDAGVRVIMVTGDHPATALVIARELGIATNPEEVVPGAALDEPGALQGTIAHARVFARVAPEQKLAIVRAAQDAGHFVAVTGDGVNDAPALRHANIGVAMGRSGTEVARDAADVVLSDDNFATIVAGIDEGRVAYQNIRNVVYLVAAAAFAEVLTVGLAVMAGLPLPLLPTQLLWLNLVTNGIQDVSLAFESRRGDELRAPPRRPDEPIFDSLMLERVALGGTWMAMLGFTAYAWMIDAGYDTGAARNILLLLMVLLQNVDTFNARSETVSAFAMPLRANPLLVVGVSAALLLHVAAMHVPVLQGVVRLAPLPPGAWLLLGGAASTLLLVMELQKLSWRRRSAVGR
jgi:magnesium-transporting ATPase (P-type)